MKRAANIIYLVAAIVSIVLAVTYIILGVAGIVFSNPEIRPEIIKAIEEGYIRSDFPGTPEEKAGAIQLMFLVSGIAFLIEAFVAGANAVIAFKARNSNSKALFITSIVLGAVTGVEINIVASIFALIKGNTIENNLE